MKTLGVHLGAQSEQTSLAVIDWGLASPQVEAVEVGVDDEYILESTGAAEMIGIAAPFSWPDEFYHFLTSHREGHLPEPRRVATATGREAILFRFTERRVREFLGVKLTPMTANMEAARALRCAGVLSRLRDAGYEVSRDGLGKVAEVAPAASLRSWGLDESTYTEDSGERAALLEVLARRLKLDLGDFRALIADEVHAFDAIVAALTAQAILRGSWVRPVSEEEQRHADTEGWICLPTGTIEELR